MIAIIQEALQNSFTYKEYRNIITEFLANDKSTGNTQSEDLLHYSQLNETRMNRLDKTIKMSTDIVSQLENLDKQFTWLVLSEGWCGDAAQILPVLNKMAEISEKIDLKIALRDDNEALMDLFLTNGGKSIPKLILLDSKTFEVISSWGPRPAPAAKLIADYKLAHGILNESIKIELQKWYLHDKGETTQKEVMKLMF